MWTNKKGLPWILAYNMSGDTYFNPYKVWPSQLDRSIRETLLSARHADEVVKDVSGGLFNLLGRHAHKILEGGMDVSTMVHRFGMPVDIASGIVGDHNKALREYRVKRKICEINGHDVILSGRLDYFSGGKISDWKITSVWKVKNKDNMASWGPQLSCYVWGLQGEAEVEKIEACAILRDWRRGEWMQDRMNYPDIPFVRQEFEIADMKETEARLVERAHKLHEALPVADNELPPCKSEEMWESDDVYAVKKNKNKRASRCLPSKESAEKWIAMKEKYAKKGEVYSIEYRPATRRKCSDYCDAAAFCNQFEEYCRG